MAIESADIVTYLSGGASNSDPNASIGGAKSSTAWTGGTLHDLFGKISGDDNAAETVDYRGIYLQNNHGSLTWESVVAWISEQTAGGADLAIGLADEGVDGTMEALADENTAPAGVSFSAAASKGAGLVIGDLEAGEYIGIWLRRTATNSAAKDADSATLSFSGDTAE